MSKLTQMLRLLRARSGLKNYEIAEKLGVTPATVSGHMSDLQSHVPDIETLIKYSEIFEIPLNDLIQAIKNNNSELDTEPEDSRKVSDQLHEYKTVSPEEIDESPGGYLVKINNLLTILEESGDEEALRIVYRFINDISSILTRKSSK